jgi:type I restriction enzyme S subunit
LKASDYVEHGIPVINVRNVGYGWLRPEKLEFVSDATAERLGVHVLAENDIVFGRKGAVDRHLLVRADQAGWMQGSDCIRLRFTSAALNPRYVSYAFLRSYHKEWMLLQCGNKATMASLNQDVIRRIELPLPSREQQDAVVSTLSAYDDLIENNRKRTALLEEAARLLYREWFVHLRFPGHEHVTVVDGVPAGWQRVELGGVLTLKRGYDLPAGRRTPGPVPVVSSSGVTGHHNQSKASGPGVVTGRYGTLGEVYFVEDEYWPLNTALYVSDFKGHDPLFVFQMLKSLLRGVGTQKAAVPGVDRNVLHTMLVVWPSASLRKAFVESIRDNQQQIQVLTAMNDKLAAARDLLLPRLMNGEIAV